MKPEKLEEISNGKYHVEESCIYKGNKKICNFYIKKLSIYYHRKKERSFAVKLRSEKATGTAIFPSYYMNDPTGWLSYEFDSRKFYSISGKDEFDRTINEVIHLMKESGEYDRIDEVMGWHSEENEDLNPWNKRLIFGDFNDPSDAVYYDAKSKPLDYIREYSKLIDTDISNVLFSYMLLSLLSSLELLGENTRPDFIITLTGGNEATRRKVALFFTNLAIKKQQDDYRQIMGNCYVESDYVFTKFDGSTYYPSYPTHALQKELKRHNLPHIRWHDLRHTAASLLLAKGWSMKDISEWLGHADIGTTMNIYGHINLEHKRELSTTLDGLLA